MSDATKVTFDLRAETVTIEGPSAALTKLFEVIHTVVPGLEVRVVPVGGNSRRDPPPTLAIASTSTFLEQARRAIDARRSEAEAALSEDRDADAFRARAFASRFQPTSTVDRIVVLAGYAISRPSGEFTSQQMEAWFTWCGYDSPPNMAVALNDAHSKAEVLRRTNRNRWMINDAGASRLRLIQRVPP